jgi:hypothetical protein
MSGTCSFAGLSSAALDDLDASGVTFVAPFVASRPRVAAETSTTKAGRVLICGAYRCALVVVQAVAGSSPVAHPSEVAGKTRFSVGLVIGTTALSYQ